MNDLHTTLSEKRSKEKKLIIKRKCRQRPTLPAQQGDSTIGAKGLDFCVRNGNRYYPFAMVTDKNLISKIILIL